MSNRQYILALAVLFVAGILGGLCSGLLYQSNSHADGPRIVVAEAFILMHKNEVRAALVSTDWKVVEGRAGLAKLDRCISGKTAL
jgi:hypothetical protein